MTDSNPPEVDPHTTALVPDWDPRTEEVLADQIAAYDRMRRTCPVAHGTTGNWAVFRHTDVVGVLEDHATFSNTVSRHVAVPNGMDPPQHTAFREVVDRYYTPERMAAFEPALREIARELVAALPRGEDVEVMEALAEPYAGHAQCAFMGWPASLHEPLREWTEKNHAATLAQDRDAMSAVALEFDSFIREQLLARRRDPDAPRDTTTDLMAEQVGDRPLTDDEIVSIVRNWTVGELGTIAASVGIIARFLAERPDVQQRLRAQPHLAEAASDEILRIHAPLIANRRRTTTPVTLGGREISEGQRVVVVWASANRDEEVFGDPDEFRLDREPGHNLLYGAGIHYCPGAPLARLELRVVMEELFAGTEAVGLPSTGEPVRAIYPASGYSTLPLRFR